MAIALSAAACGGVEQSPTPEDQRVLKAQINPENASALSLHAVALQLAAVAVDTRLASPILDFQASSSVSPSANGGAPVTLFLALPMDKSYILYLQVPVDGRKGLGRMVGRLRFKTSNDGSWSGVLNGRARGITSPLSDIELGELKLVSAVTGDDSSRDLVIELGGNTSENPLTINDNDGDGTPDFDDADDDNDFIPDTVDDDANGDDIPDQNQSYDALLRFDANADQVPDIFQP